MIVPTVIDTNIPINPVVDHSSIHSADCHYRPALHYICCCYEIEIIKKKCDIINMPCRKGSRKKDDRSLCLSVVHHPTGWLCCSSGKQISEWLISCLWVSHKGTFCELINDLSVWMHLFNPSSLNGPRKLRKRDLEVRVDVSNFKRYHVHGTLLTRTIY